MKLETNYTLTLPNGTVVNLTPAELDELYRQLQEVYNYKVERTKYKTATEIEEFVDKLKEIPTSPQPTWQPPTPTYVKDQDKIIC